MTAPPEDESWARLEASMEGLAREISDIKADTRDLRTTTRRNFLILIVVMVAMWLVTISLLIATMFRM